jgi:hypothetical protein
VYIVSLKARCNARTYADDNFPRLGADRDRAELLQNC